MLENDLITNLRDRYVALAIQYGESKKEGKFEDANKLHKELSETSDSLNKIDPESRDFIVTLLSHAEPFVRLWAATDSKEYNPKEAIATLRELKHNNDLAGLDAWALLSMWGKE